MTLFSSKSHYVHMTIIFQSSNTHMLSLWSFPNVPNVELKPTTLGLRELWLLIHKHKEKNHYGCLINLFIIHHYYHYTCRMPVHMHKLHFSYEVTPLLHKG